MFEGLLELIEQSDVITLYRHIHPDCDALGSQWALARWIKHRFPLKRVLVLGFDTMTDSLFDESDIAEDEIIKQSLAIILDTANVRRIDDQRWSTAQTIVQIDHHPQIEHYAHHEYVLDHYAATCEILAEFFRSVENKPLPSDVAVCLYRGLLTDTLSFKTSNTTSHTLAMASFVAESGINIPQINRDLFDVTLNEYRFAQAIRQKAQILDDKLMIAVIDQSFLDEWGMSASRAKDQVYQFGNIREIEVWAIFARDHDDLGNSWWAGSLRSKTIQVNDIAMNYRGGGHKNAAGCKCLDDESLNRLIADLRQRVKEA